MPTTVSGMQALSECDCGGVGVLAIVGDRDREMTRVAGSTLRAWGVGRGLLICYSEW